MIDLEACSHCLGFVVVPLIQRPTAGVAHPFPGRWIERGVIGCLTLATNPAARQTAHQFLVGHGDVEHAVQLPPHVGQHGIQALGLGLGAGEAIEDGAPVAIGPLQPIPHHGDGHVVGHQFALVHVRLGQQAKFCLVPQVLAEQVTASHVG